MIAVLSKIIMIMIFAITKQSYFVVQYADYKTMSHNLDLGTFQNHKCIPGGVDLFCVQLNVANIIFRQPCTVHSSTIHKAGRNSTSTRLFRIRISFIARYVCTYEEFVLVIEAPQCDRMTVTRQDTDNTNNNIQNRQCVKIAQTQYTK